MFDSKGPFLLTSHVNPDGDAIGSVLAVYHYVVSRGEKADIILPSSVPKNLQWMPGAENIMVWKGTDLQKQLIFEAKVIAVLDLNSLNRLEGLGTAIRESHAVIINVDHHTHPEHFSHEEVLDESAPSTTYILSKFLLQTPHSTLESPSSAHQSSLSASQSSLATCLYVGLMTDTGSFRFPRTDAGVMQLAAELIDLGADPVECYEKIYNVDSINRMRLLGTALSGMQLFHDGKLCVMTVSLNDMRKHECAVEDTEGFVHHTLSVEGVVMGVLLLEVPGTIKCSLRSKGNVYVRDLAAKYGGGGHVYAAGARISKPLNEVVEILVKEAAAIL